MPRILLLVLVVTLIPIIKFSPVYSQGQETPDVLSGFRDFEFYSTIVDYSGYDYCEISYCDVFDCSPNKYKERSYKYNFDHKSTLFEVYLPTDETQFLKTNIKKVIIEQYRKKICRITIVLENDINDLLDKLFRHSDGKENIKTYWALNYEEIDPFYFKTAKRPEPEIRISTYKQKMFFGNKTTLEYGKYIINEYRSFDEGIDPLLGQRYSHRPYNLHKYFYLTFEAVGYKEEIGGEYGDEHYDSYLSDFGAKHFTSEDNTKLKYTIPLYLNENTHYVIALFGGVVLEDLVFDTGASHLIISRNLYKKLKDKNLLTDETPGRIMVLGNGEKVEFKKVIIKGIQLFDLKIDFIEAYVNTSEEISLLGQSFLNRFGSISVDYKTNVLTISK